MNLLTMNPLTQVERHGDFWLKRDDLFSFESLENIGGKGRAVLALSEGGRGLVTCGSRESVQITVVARVAEYLKIPCAVYVPMGKETKEMAFCKAHGATIEQVQMGFPAVLSSRAKRFALYNGWLFIPYGLACGVNKHLVADQVQNVPAEVKRIVVPAGSGMTMAGICTGLARYGRQGVAVIGVVVGGDPRKNLTEFCPQWQLMSGLRVAAGDYHTPVKVTLDHVVLDPYYEAKCFPFLEPGDLLWVAGVRPASLIEV